MLRRLFIAITIAAAAGVAGCNGGTASPPPFFTGTLVTPSPTPTPVPVQHLYVGNDNPSGEVFQYTLPITAASTSNFTLTAPAPGNVFGLGLDATGNLAVGLINGTLQFYNAPLSGASVPAATFSNAGAGGTGQITFTPAGDFFVGGTKVNMFTHPFSNASTPSSSISNPAITYAIAAPLDAAQNLYVVDEGSGTGGKLLVYAPPYTGAPIITAIAAGTNYRKAAISPTQLFVTSVGGLQRVDVYNLPITAASVPAFSITNGANNPEAAAVDAAGNLYVGNLGNHTVTVYAPPFSAASAPTVTLTVGSAAFAIFAIAIGK
jgi:hypothetical protein